MVIHYVIGIRSSDWWYIQGYITAVYQGFVRPHWHLEEGLDAT